MPGKITLPHRCPKCGKVARNYEELERLFGFRNMNDDSGSTVSTRNQSWCRECRSKYN